ncbi:MAG: hypothetical protein A3I39_01825 [Candidatus Yanofskybacteria bacterium RIFCSPLOWO2_02_FULL_47_9b]|uniref:Elongation factor P C-terminal domain-containing protein n=1 Tax=Candidatus Yanofskybacteria bacterium RIFCSPLOWO2_02_FULL_47_9b TaxID=1802708 RepID=A0A1F8HA76_9BACT|nr:MAG: hypothetical protein A3I39_01825 [Candidatus Yanofskybacteria bacterium RIFCSPLOWO2_02_FULL_47_9b]
MALGVNELKPKTYFLYEDQPYMVVETHHLKMQQRRPTVQVRMRNLINGKMLERNFAQSDVFDEADIARRNVKFLYAHRDQYFFSYTDDPAKRFQLNEEVLGDASKFMKANTAMDAIEFDGNIITVDLPVKMDFKVTEAPPAIRGDTAQGGVKQVTIETGATINAPLFIEQNDIIRINTQTGDYVERVEKSK